MNRIEIGPDLDEHINLNGNATEHELQDAKQTIADQEKKIIALQKRNVSRWIIAVLTLLYIGWRTLQMIGWL